MDARTLVDQLTLDLLVKKSIDAALCQSLVSLLAQNSNNNEVRSLAEDLQRLALANEKSVPQRHEKCLALLEALSVRIDEKAIKPSSAKQSSARRSAAAHEAVSDTVLAYDISHGQDILDSFFAELSDHLQTLEQMLLILETDARCREALNAVFGAMHSLKGIMGFLDLKFAHRLAHEAEAVMESARNREAGISGVECDVILRSVDVLRGIQTLIRKHSQDTAQAFPQIPTEYHQILREIKDVARSSKPGAAATPVSENANAPLIPGENKVKNSETKIQTADTFSAVRVKVEKLDSLMEAIGELVVVQAQVNQDPFLRHLESSRLAGNLSQLGKITRDLQSIAMALRMYPLRETFGRMTRLARDLAHKQKKEIEVVVTGDETELDKNVIEALVDPLTHLIRNAIDHGVGTPEARLAAGKPARGRLEISARHQSGSVIVTITDDGRGLDLEKIQSRARAKGLLGSNERPSDLHLRNLIFEPGFTTTEKVTELSGRGVGLDVVRRNIQALGGSVTVNSVPGQSTTFALTLPLTLAIIDGLIVRAGSEHYIVPITSVVESVRPAREQVSKVQERGELINARGALLPLVRLSEFMGVAPGHSDPWDAIVMIIECGNDCCGLMVDELLGQQQVVIRSLGENLKNVRGIASGTILGDGKVGLILDVAQLARSYGVARHAQARVDCAAG